MFRIQSLGGASVTDPHHRPIRLRSRKHLGLLVYLAAGGSRLFTRESLAGLLWSTEPSRSRHSLSQAIYDLRRNLGGALIQGPGEDIRLDPTLVRLDALEFEAAVKRGDLERAVDLYRGPFGDNLSAAGTPDFERWVEQERLRYARMAEFVLRRYARVCDDAGQWGEMCVAALKLIKVNMLDEEAHRVLMRGLWMHGDATSALRHYEETAPHLEKELAGGVSEETHELARRIRKAPHPRQLKGRFVDRDPPFLGREAEFEFLREVVGSMGDGGPTALIVYGESGIGKTRLLKEFTPLLLLEHVRLIESRCYPAESEVPYGPIAESLRPIAAEIARTISPNSGLFTRLGHLLPEFEHLCRARDQGADPAAWRRRMYEEVANLVRQACASRPLVWVIEDVHWIDVTSASLLHYITRRLEGEQFLLIASIRVARDEDLPSTVPVSTAGPNGLTRTLRLSALTEDHIRRVVLHLHPEAESHPGVGLAQHLSAGNPLLALEVFRAAIDSLEWTEQAQQWAPLSDSRLGKLLAVRVEGLSPGALKLLQAIAVLERQATPASLCGVAGCSLTDAAEKGEELYQRGLIRDRDTRLEFANDVIREYVYADMSALERAALHRRAGEHLRRDPDAGSATLARHYHLGDDRENTYKYALRAGQEAAASGGHNEAAVMAGLALSVAQTGQQRLSSLNLLAESELGSAQLTAAAEHFEQILRLDEEMSLERRIEVKLRIVRALGAQAKWDKAVGHLGDLEAQVRNVPGRTKKLELQFEILNWLLKAASRRNDWRGATLLSRKINRLHRGATSGGHLTEAANITARCSLAAYEAFYGAATEATRLLTDCRFDQRDVPAELQLRVHLMRGLAHLRQASWDKADYEAKQALAVAERTKDVLHLSAVLNNLTCSAMERGDWREAERLGQRTMALHEALGSAFDASLPIRLNAANLAFYKGQVAEALNTYRQALELAERHQLNEFMAELQACVGLTSLQIGELRLARDCWEQVQQWSDDQLQGVQERFKIEWFRGFMLRRSHPTEVAKRLATVAKGEECTDRVSFLKLCFLQTLLVPGTRSPVPEDELRDVGLGWFVRFAERWLRSADARAAGVRR